MASSRQEKRSQGNEAHSGKPETWQPAWTIKWCRDGGQHTWLPTTGKGLPCYSCPMCEQVIYWSEINLKWVKPGESGGKPIPGNQVERMRFGETVSGERPTFSKLAKGNSERIDN